MAPSVTTQARRGVSAISQSPVVSEAEICLRAAGIEKSFGGQVVLRGIDATLRCGEVVLLRGANGSGKTTLLNILTGNLEADAGRISLQANGSNETFEFPLPAWRRLHPFGRFSPEHFARSGVGRTWQSMRLFGSLSLRENLMAAAPSQIGEHPMMALLRVGKVRNQERELKAASDSLLAELGLDSRSSSSADRISLGQAKRIAITRAVAAGAKILLLDEPLSGLDRRGANDVLALLRRLVGEEGLTLIIVEHILNIPLILDLATTVWTLEDGAMRVQYPDEVVFEPGGLESCLMPLSQVSSGETNRIWDLGAGASLKIWTPANPGEEILSVRDLVVFRGQRLVIGRESVGGVSPQGVSFELRRGDLAFLEAPNGWGKSTLMECLAGLIPAAAGSVTFQGQDIRDLQPWERHAWGLSLLRSGSHAFPGLTVDQVLQIADAGPPPPCLNCHARRYLSELSGGEQQMVGLASAFGNGRFSVALLDEPSGALDESAIARLVSSIQAWRNQAAVFVAAPLSIAGGVS